MNIVAKSLVASAVALALSGVALAEESGAFAGVELGLNSGKLKAEIKSTLPDPDLNYGESSKNSIGFLYGIKGGYKHFITDDFGVRGYIYLSKQDVTYKWSDSDDDKTNAIRYGAGVDALYNFADDLGVFAGLSLGNNSYKIEFPDGKKTETDIDIAINLGARMNIEKVHGVEIGLSVPVVHPKLERNYYAVSDSGDIGRATLSATPKTTASLKVSYLFNF